MTLTGLDGIALIIALIGLIPASYLALWLVRVVWGR